MLTKLNSTNAVTEPLLEAPLGLGDTLELFLGGETVAKVSVTELPETTKWGSAIMNI